MMGKSLQCKRKELLDNLVCGENTFPMLSALRRETKCFSLNDIVAGLKTLITEWVAERQDRPLVVSLASEKLGSEFYFYDQLKDLLPKHKILRDYSEISKLEAELGRIELLCIDDWTLSGINAMLIMRNLHETWAKTKALAKTKTILFTIITHISTSEGRQLISKYAEEYSCVPKFYFNQDIELFKTVLSREAFDETEIDRFIDCLCQGQYDPYAIFLEYKIANMHGTFHMLYKAIFDMVKIHAKKTEMMQGLEAKYGRAVVMQ